MRSIRARLTTLVAVPTAALVVLAAVGVAVQASNYGAAGRTLSGVQLVLTTQDLVHELQRERGLTNGLLGGQAGYRSQLGGQRVRADDAVRSLDGVLNSSPASVAGPVRDSLGSLADLGELRAEVDAGAADRSRTFDFYTAAIARLDATSGDAVEADVSDPELLRNLQALRALGEAKEATALQRGFLNGVFSADAFRDREYARFAEIRAARLAALDDFAARATQAQQSALDAALRTQAAAQGRELEQRAIDGASVPSLGVAASRWWDAMTTLVDDERSVQQLVGADANRRAAALRTASLRWLVLFVGLAVLALVVAVALVVVAARSIIRPLHLLATDARDVARKRLPGAVARVQAGEEDVTALEPDSPIAALSGRNDEIAEVARALDQVQSTAVHLAQQEALLRRNAAESMSNLARRNQNLLRRQLGFISELERDETDARALANLFELDHLATRMRRNAESLLVLIGEHSPRRGSRPVPVADVVRAALAEVEDYRRVTLRRLDEVLVVGVVGADLAHLLAELVENALSFSPPHREVEIFGQSAGSGYVLAIVDHGVGMSFDELARANSRLLKEETFVVAPTRFLGHYVVGQLAGRIGVDVRLQESPLSGVTARVTLPAELLAETSELESGPAAGATDLPDGKVATPPPDAHHPRQPDDAEVVKIPQRVLSHGSWPTRRPVAVLEAAPPAVAARPTEAGTAGSPQPGRTRNGLVKRVRATPAADDAGPRPVTGPVATRTPDQARQTLTSFRAGFARGANSPDTHTPADAPEDGAQ